jgi:hypothetical protein
MENWTMIALEQLPGAAGNANWINITLSDGSANISGVGYTKINGVDFLTVQFPPRRFYVGDGRGGRK